MESHPLISFDNTENAFEYKTDKQLKKANFLFKTMGYDLLVKLGTRITPWAMKSGLPINGILRNTIFSQFVGGETLDETAKMAREAVEGFLEVLAEKGEKIPVEKHYPQRLTLDIEVKTPTRG